MLRALSTIAFSRGDSSPEEGCSDPEARDAGGLDGGFAAGIWERLGAGSDAGDRTEAGPSDRALVGAAGTTADGACEATTPAPETSICLVIKRQYMNSSTCCCGTTRRAVSSA